MGRRKLNSVEGLCYVEDVHDINDKKVTAILFNNYNIPIKEANRYLKDIRETKTSSYNSLIRIARDVCYLYNFKLEKRITISTLNLNHMGEYVEYLKEVKVRAETEGKTDFKRPKFAIENSLCKQTPKKLSNKGNKVIRMDYYGGLSDESISRAFHRSISFLKHLQEEGFTINSGIIDKFSCSEDIDDFLKSKNVEAENHEVIPVERDEIFSLEQMKEIAKACSAPYERLLDFILEKTGFRIGEGLGLKIFFYDLNNLRSIKGDIKFKADGRWYIKVVWRPENPPFCRAKSHCSREIALLKSEITEFEILLSRYLKWREKKVKKRDKEWLFISSRGNHLTQNVAYSQFKRTVNKILLPGRQIFTLHTYRHTWSVIELLKGIPIEFVSKALGHKSIETTQEFYCNFTAGNMVEIREKYQDSLKERELRYACNQ